MNNQEEYDDMFDFKPSLEHDNIYAWLKSHPLKEAIPGIHASNVYKYYKINILSCGGCAVDEPTFHKIIAPFSFVIRTPESDYLYQQIDFNYHTTGETP